MVTQVSASLGTGMKEVFHHEIYCSIPIQIARTSTHRSIIYICIPIQIIGTPITSNILQHPDTNSMNRLAQIYKILYCCIPIQIIGTHITSNILQHPDTNSMNRLAQINKNILQYPDTNNRHAQIYIT